MTAAPSVRQGSIWMAEVRDPRGHAKLRPVVVVTSTDEIMLDQPIVAAANTTTFPDPALADQVELPWSPRGHPATGLWKRSAAVCSWLVEVRPSDLREQKGYVPSKTLLQLLRKVRDFVDGPGPEDLR